MHDLTLQNTIHMYIFHSCLCYVNKSTDEWARLGVNMIYDVLQLAHQLYKFSYSAQYFSFSKNILNLKKAIKSGIIQ